MASLNWPQRFAVIEHFNPSEEQICSTFGVSREELQIARMLKSEGAFANVDRTFDPSKHGELFGIKRAVVKSHKNTTAHKRVVQRVKTVNNASVPVKRGRQSNKIATALLQVPETPVSAEEFSKQHDVSVAVLRQSKRFIEKMSAEERASVGTIFVRQDKTTKQLMIWRG